MYYTFIPKYVCSLLLYMK